MELLVVDDPAVLVGRRVAEILAGREAGRLPIEVFFEQPFLSVLDLPPQI